MTSHRRVRDWILALACVLLVTAGAVLVPPPPHAAAAPGLALVGDGFGHGIGMSQYGARYRAEAGHSYSQILSHYYPGTTLATGSDGAQIRVRIEADADNVTTIARERGLRVKTARGTVQLPGRVGSTIPSHWRIRISGGSLVVEAKLGGSWRNPGITALTSILRGQSYAQFADSDGSVRLVIPGAYRDYVGVVRAVRPAGTTSSLRTVVFVRYRHYLPSVVASEMPTSWAAHALRAQAVAARTYAMFDAASKPSGSYYDTCDTTSCQVFNGRADYTAGGSLVRAWSTSSTIGAVDATAGRYLRYGGGPAFTQFSASNGGYSVAGSFPYLRAAPDPYDGFPMWQVTISSSALQRTYPSIGSFIGISTVRDGRGPFGGRVTQIELHGARGSVTVTGAEFRFAFGLRSTLFRTMVTDVPASAGRDVDRDGSSDLVSISPAGRAYVWLGDDRPGFGSPIQVGGAWTGKEHVTLTSNVTGAGFAEILAVEGSSNDLVAYPLTPDVEIGTRSVVHTGNWSRYDLFMGVENFSGNGRPGLLARGRTTGQLYYFEADGRGGLGSRQSVQSGWSGIDLATSAGDWNRDGDADVVAIDGTRLWLYPGDGDGGLEPRVLLSQASGWSTRTSIVARGDWNGDGRPDLLSVSAAGNLMINASTASGGVATGRPVVSGWSHELLG